jgi:hypothetical protein
MPYTPEQTALIASVLPTLPLEVKALIDSKPTSETVGVLSMILSGERQQGMEQLVESLVSGTVSDWNALRQAASVADGATLQSSLVSLKAALDAGSANFFAQCVVAVFAALKHHGVS